MLTLVALLIGACKSDPATAPTQEVNDMAGARDAALEYLQEHEGQGMPGKDVSWHEEDTTPALVGAGTREFTFNGWTVKVFSPVVAPQYITYQITVTSTSTGLHWKGTVKPDGTVTETSPVTQMSMEGSQAIAEEFVRNSPTFTSDGMEDTLQLTETLTARCPYCWSFVFEFDSRAAGYGDRTGQVLAQVITHHRAVIAVELCEIMSAVMDDKWDMLTQTEIKD